MFRDVRHFALDQTEMCLQIDLCRCVSGIVFKIKIYLEFAYRPIARFELLGMCSFEQRKVSALFRPKCLQVGGQSLLAQLVFPTADNNRGDTVANEVGEGAAFAHETVDAYQQRQ